MYTKETTYIDFDGTEVTEELCFHLTKAEITEMEYSVGGGLVNMIQRLQKEQDVGKIIDLIKSLILKAYGEKVTDRKGRERFVKTEAGREFFQATEAYSAMFMNFLEDPDSFNAFLIGILPVDMQKDVKDQLSKGGDTAMITDKGSVAPPKAVR